MEVKNLQNQKGFTLVEIAIVLVIIGLLLGGVLKGQELITNSKIKSVTQDFDGLSAAYYAYQDRIGRVPGDTDNDGLINDNQTFWNDLRSEGFVKGVSGSTAPVHALDGQFSAVGGGTTGSLFAKNSICASNIEPTVAGGMDTKLDDGVNTTGIVESSSGYTGTTVLTICKEL
jgi:prepilin-type N-terminal cleavage/methylation domain-containing protein